MKRDRSARAPSFAAVIFDMDGVVTRTAQLHAACWNVLLGVRGAVDLALPGSQGEMADQVWMVPVPVLLLPTGYRESLPWDSALVPLSGELEADEALALAMRLANTLGLILHVAHVAQSAKSTRTC